jgi:outer membrane protein assembly factor BamD
MNRKTSCISLVLTILLLLPLFWGCGPKPHTVILDAEDQYAVAKREFDSKHWDRAVVELQKLVFNHPGAAFIDSAQYLLGMAYFNQKEYPSAILEFNKILYSFPTSQLADDAAFLVAKSDFEMAPRAELDPTNTERALEEVRRFLDDYPQSDRRPEAEELLNKCLTKLAKKAYQAGVLYYKRGRYEAALIYLEHVLNDYHDTKWVKDAQFRLAEVYYKQGEYGKAREEYQKFVDTFPDDKLVAKAQDRLKKIGEKQNRGEQAEKD